MISASDLNDLITKKKALIDSFDAAKKKHVYDLRDDLLKLIKRFKNLEKQVDDDKNPPPDLSGAITNLGLLETQAKPIETELRNILIEADPVTFSRDPSDAGTIGGNGSVVFRTNGRSFFVPAGTLTQQQIEDAVSKGTISALKSKP
jgi:hypothetical protein